MSSRVPCFYGVVSSAGEEHTKDRKLGFNPCSISYLNGGSYIAVGGSNRKATLYTKVRLYDVAIGQINYKYFHTARSNRPFGRARRRTTTRDKNILPPKYTEVCRSSTV